MAPLCLVDGCVAVATRGDVCTVHVSAIKATARAAWVCIWCHQQIESGEWTTVDGTAHTICPTAPHRRHRAVVRDLPLFDAVSGDAAAAPLEDDANEAVGV